MKHLIPQNFQKLLFRNFNLCFFAGLFLLSVLPTHQYISFDTQSWTVSHLIIPFGNGICTGLVMLAVNKYFTNKNYTHPYYPQDKLKLFFIAFSAGFLGCYIAAAPVTTYLISLLIIYIAIMNIRYFAQKLSALLQSDQRATLQDRGQFANFFINLIISFAVINLSINTIHGSLNLEQAFNFGKGFSAIIDAFYFSAITMTTVGYGDIVPHTLLARFIVALECLTSYTMLGIMIGIITRGIKLTKK